MHFFFYFNRLGHYQTQVNWVLGNRILKLQTWQGEEKKNKEIWERNDFQGLLLFIELIVPFSSNIGHGRPPSIQWWTISMSRCWTWFLRRRPIKNCSDRWKATMIQRTSLRCTVEEDLEFGKIVWSKCSYHISELAATTKNTHETRVSFGEESY